MSKRITNMTTCPDWCTAPECVGDHYRSAERLIPANRSYFPVINEQGAIYPTVGVGLYADPSSHIAPTVTLSVAGLSGNPDGAIDLDFDPNQAFELAVQILDQYRMVAEETDRPSAPESASAVTSILDSILHHLTWADRDPEIVARRRKAHLRRLCESPEGAVPGA